MKVVIVAKTRMGSGACIGGLTFDGHSVRLVAPDAATNDHFNMEYAVGDVWEIEGGPPAEITPPHTENLVVQRKRRLPSIDDLETFIRQRMPPRVGGPDVLYDGLAQQATSGALYIAQRTGVPTYSTLFWQPDRPLVRDTESKRIHYRYTNSENHCTLTFVGFQEPLEEIPAGSLVRVSLAHWWRPEDHPQDEFRCYVQLSGWVLPGSGEWRAEPPVRKPANKTEPAEPGGSLDQARALLKRIYGYEDFRPLQGEIIDNILQKKDTLAVMPTGSGKSLCYQLPALLFRGLTVVVTPLISLMEDQVMQLRELDVPAAYLNGTLSYDEYVAVVREIRAGKIKLVYAAPETLLRPESLALLDDCRVDCLTIDEAHCISEWGHDFRPEYRQLLDVRRRIPESVCLGVTATATERVREDIKATMAIHDADEFVAGFDRDNLFLAAEPRVDGLAQVLSFLEAHRGESGIIYCWTRETVEQLAADLSANGWPALPYHAGLDTPTRQKNQRQFSHDQAPIIVATIAFGMGINKSNVRFVVHYDLPKDLECYYQQIGRAGRDGLRADCLLLYGQTEVQTAMHFIDRGSPGQRIGATMRLKAMQGFAETTDCRRRRPLLAYFGDELDRDHCGFCDNCLTDRDGSDQADLTVPAQKFLSCVKRTGELFGVSHITDILRGSRNQKITSRGHEQLSTYGIGREFSTREWRLLAGQFLQRGLLIQDMEHGSLKLTPLGREVLKGKQFYGAMPSEIRERAQPFADLTYDRALFELLRVQRLEIAQERGLPPYMIFNDASLREMATYYPQSRSSFTSIYGVGEQKAERYGALFLEIIIAYCREHNVAEKQKTVQRSAVTGSSRRSSPTRQHEVAEAFDQGHSIAAIAQSYGLSERTITRHLGEFVMSGGLLNTDNLLRESKLTPVEQARVLREFELTGTAFLRPVYEALEESVSYDELHILRMYAILKKTKEG